MELKTPLGTLKMKLNNVETNYNWEPLPLVEKSFKVDHRYKILLELPEEKEYILKYYLENKEILDGKPDTGEDLAMITFHNSVYILSIGIEDSYPSMVSYQNNGITKRIEHALSKNKIVLGIAWLKICDEEKQSTYTWYAADPTLFE